MGFDKNLQNRLRELDEPISMYDLAKEFDLNIDDFLRRIQVIQQDYSKMYNVNVQKIINGGEGFEIDFFKQDIIDLGMLVQHLIKEIADELVEKHNTFGHRIFKDQWLLHRGY